MEYLDVYDSSKHLTGRTHKRGEPYKDGDYFLIIHLWIMNSRREYLMQRRSLQKEIYPGYWDCAATGFAIHGDTSEGATLRELREELGIELQPSQLMLLDSTVSDRFIGDTYFAVCDIGLSALRLQSSEVMEARWMSEAELDDLQRQGIFMWGKHYKAILRGIEAYDGKTAYQAMHPDTR